jgi:LuxR family transcriptional regulator, maltose regulon positive regulatory protein
VESRFHCLRQRAERVKARLQGVRQQVRATWAERSCRPAALSRRAIDLAERHGRTDETAAGIAYMALGSVLAWQGRLDEAEAWLQRAERTVRAEADPAVALAVHHIRAQLELARGREAGALAAFRAAERLAGHLAAPNALATPMRALLRLAQDDPDAATVALAPVLDESAPVGWRSWLVEAFLLEAIARDAWVAERGSRSVQRRFAEGGEQRQAGHQPGDLITD